MTNTAFVVFNQSNITDGQTNQQQHHYHSKTNEDELKIPIQFTIYASVAQKTNHAHQQGISFTLSLHSKQAHLYRRR